MEQYISKDALVAEINRRIEKCNIFYIVADNNNAKDAMEEIKREIQHYKSLLDFLNVLEVKEINSTNSFIEKSLKFLDGCIPDYIDLKHANVDTFIDVDNERFIKDFINHINGE